MFNLNNANMENLITQINKERLVNSDTALMMKELYYYVPCEYWYDKQDRLRTDIEGRMRLYCMENNDEEVSSRHFP